MSDWYYLRHRKPVPFGCTVLTDPKKFFTLLGKHSKHRKIRKHKVGEYVISTIFLGLDHNCFGGEPLIFETMVFKDGNIERQTRAYTHRQALKEHRDGISFAKSW